MTSDLQQRLNHAVTGLSKLIADVEPIAVTGRMRKALSDARAALDAACNPKTPDNQTPDWRSFCATDEELG